jgi:methionyl-tRNA formyltransferase
MRVVFVGASSFGLRCLKSIIDLADISVVGIVTNPKTFKISYSSNGVQNVLHADFGTWAAEKNVPQYLMTKTMKEPALKAWLASRRPDLMVVVGWYHMIPGFLRDIAPAIGLHASLLPDYSGGAPLVWAMINGERETGITLFQMSDGVDNGPIYGQAVTEVSPQDTIATLYARIEDLGISLLREYLPKIARGEAVPVAQNEQKRRVFPQRCPEEGLIDWRQSASKLYDFVRAQTKPYPGAFSFIQGKKVTILSCKCLQQGKLPTARSAGTAFYEEDHKRVIVFTGQDGIIELGLLVVDGAELPATTFFLEYLHLSEAMFDVAFTGETTSAP